MKSVSRKALGCNMLNEFYLDRSVFSAQPLRDEALSVLHDILIEYWGRYGVLVMPNGSGEEYLELIKGLPPKFHQRWINAFSNFSRFESSERWGGLETCPSFKDAANLRQFFLTALVEDTLGAVICNNEKLLRSCPESFFEMVGVGSVTESVNFGKARDRAIRDIGYGDDIKEVWRERFESFAKYSGRIYISDRYVFNSVLRDASEGRKSSIAKFIEMLPGWKKFSITILSDGGGNSDELCVEVQNYFSKYIMRSPPLSRKLSCLNLVSMSSENFKKFAHDRYVRFDKHVCQIGVGMAIFDAFPVPATTFSVKNIYESTAREIERLALSSLWREIYKV